MIPVTDNRPGTIDCKLCVLKPGETFLWNEYLCVVVNTTGVKAHAKDDDHMLCMAIGSAKLVDISKFATITQCDCEIDIIA